jgi:1-acyl-sn-glycerol-3-phosphate acyltransferase
MNFWALHNSVSIFTDTLRYVHLSNKPEWNIDDLKSRWARSILERLNVHLTVKGEPTLEPSTLFVGNHISYLDIALLLSSAPRLSFVAKKELAMWPVFGAAAKKVDTVFVKRESGASRQSARAAVSEALTNGKRVVVFPSGTTCVEESKPWRKGAFEIAAEGGFQIQPFKITYSPLRAVAYIDKDFFPWHLYKLGAVPRVEATIEFASPSKVIDAAADCARWHEWSKPTVY